MNTEMFLSRMLQDLKVELSEEFDRNFERKAFFDEPWPQTKGSNRKGSLMNRSGDLRKSIKSSTDKNSIEFTSSLPYASLHNQGGTLTVTMKMKKYFWAMYLKLSGNVKKRKDGSASKSKSSQIGNTEAQYYKSLALMKVGSKLVVPKRQYIGHHKQVDRIVRDVVDDNAKEFAQSIFQQLKNQIQ